MAWEMAASEPFCFLSGWWIRQLKAIADQFLRGSASNLSACTNLIPLASVTRVLWVAGRKVVGEDGFCVTLPCTESGEAAAATVRVADHTCRYRPPPNVET
jgi:hypothetical protein